MSIEEEDANSGLEVSFIGSPSLAALSEMAPDQEEVFQFADAVKLRKNLSSAFEEHASSSTTTFGVQSKIAQFEKKNTAAKKTHKKHTVPSSDKLPAVKDFSVHLRIRPLDSKTKGESTVEILPNSNTTIHTIPPADSNAAKVLRDDASNTSISGVREYEFAQVLGPASQQNQVYGAVAAPLVQGLWQGESALLFAYGSTNAGKSHTIMGSNISKNRSQDQGILPRALGDLFSRMKGESGYSLNMSYLEIYNEQVHDLLPLNQGSKFKPPASLRLGESSNGDIKVLGLNSIKLKDVQHGLSLALEAKRMRRTCSNNINDDSSRSHCICQLDLISTSTGQCNKLWIVDLAGSERTKRTGANAVRQKEAAHINKSLMTLHRCLHALRDKSNKVISFRESKLTHLFMKHWTGPSAARTTMVVCINPSAADYDETQHILAHAVMAKSVQTQAMAKPVSKGSATHYDMNGRKRPANSDSSGPSRSSKIARMVKKYSPKNLLPKTKKRKSDDQTSTFSGTHGTRPPIARPPVASTATTALEIPKLQRQVQSLEAKLAIAEADAEQLRLNGSEQMAELEERVRSEVSHEMGLHLEDTRREYDSMIEDLQQQIHKPAVGKSERKLQMDRAEQMISEMSEQVEECEEEMTRMREVHEKALQSLHEEHSNVVAEMAATHTNQREELEQTTIELKETVDDLLEKKSSWEDEKKSLQQEHTDAIEEMATQHAVERQQLEEANTELEKKVEDLKTKNKAFHSEKEALISNYERIIREQSDEIYRDEVQYQSAPGAENLQTEAPAKLTRTRASKVAVVAMEKPARNTRGSKAKMSQARQPFGAICENADESSEGEDDNLVFPKNGAVFDDKAGRYQRPKGRGPKGREWSPHRGAWRLSMA